MGKIKDLTGQRFGKLTVRQFLRIGKDRSAIWLCDCDCGNTTEVSTKKLTSKNTKSCGCLREELHKTHGLSDTKLFNVWSGMKQRCYNATTSNYKDYGGRGIKMCDEWLNDFKVFYDWAMENGYEDGLSLDRIDVDGNYEPNNCRWTNDYIQVHNRRLDKLYTYNGKTMSVRDWCKEIGFYWSLFDKKYHTNKKKSV